MSFTYVSQRRTCFVCALALVIGSAAVATAQTPPPPLYISPTSSFADPIAGLDFPSQGYDKNEGTSARAVVSRKCMYNTCDSLTETRGTTWTDVPNGFRPEEVQVKWEVSASGQLYGVLGSTRLTATLEYYTAGSGWQILDQQIWTNLTYAVTYADYRNTWKSVSVSSTEATGQMMFRARIKAELTRCNYQCYTYDYTGVSGTITVYEVRIKAKPPQLTVFPNPVVRGEQVTFTVDGAPGATISSWRFDVSDVGVAETISRTTDTGSSTWSGKAVAGGKAKASALIQNFSYPLESVPPLVVSKRNWLFPPVAAQKQDNPYTFTCHTSSYTLTALHPGDGTVGHDGAYALCVEGDVPIGEIEAVPDGPNKDLKWITEASDKTTFDWVIHKDIEDPSSDWYEHQCDNWSPGPGAACGNIVGTGFISGDNYRLGTIRHESGLTNSHYAQYVAAQNDPANNLKAQVEDLVGSTQTTPTSVRNTALFRMMGKYTIIGSASASPEPCDQTCDSSCTTTRGRPNFKNQVTGYATCPSPVDFVQLLRMFLQYNDSKGDRRGQ